MARTLQVRARTLQVRAHAYGRLPCRACLGGTCDGAPGVGGAHGTSAEALLLCGACMGGGNDCGLLLGSLHILCWAAEVPRDSFPPTCFLKIFNWNMQLSYCKSGEHMCKLKLLHLWVWLVGSTAW